MAFDCVFFDLDGTLTDSAPGITNAVAYALEKCGITPPAREELYCFIGPPLLESFMKYYGMDEAQARQAVAFYREYYPVKGLYENSVYEGLEELLDRLGKAGVTICLATAKPEEFSVKILRHFGLALKFDFMTGATFDGSLMDKGHIIRFAMSKLPEKAGRRILMVGDRHHDIHGANKNGLPCAAVMWGFGSREEFESCGAEYIVNTVQELENIIMA